MPIFATESLYEALGGFEGVEGLAHAWHVRVLNDDVVSHAFSHGFHPDHTVRLATYWAEVLGGPERYGDSYGTESDVVRLHSGNGEHSEMDSRAIECFKEALVDVGFDRDERLATALIDYFVWTTAHTFTRYTSSKDDVPDNLIMPHWSYDGLVEE